MKTLALLLLIAACDSNRAQSTKQFEKAASTAQLSFEDKKQVRLFGVHAERSMLGSQPAMIATFASQVVERELVLGKLAVFKLRLADADAAIAALEDATAETWSHRDAVTVDAMQKLEAARDDAWSTLENARRIPTSS